MKLGDQLKKLRAQALDAEEETPTTEEAETTSEEEPSDVIRAKLREIGNKHEVNPPSEKEEVIEAPKTELELPKDKEKCPTCGKEFTHLAKHKCKTEATAAVVPNVALKGTAKPVKKVLDEAKAEIQGNISKKKFCLCIDCIPSMPFSYTVDIALPVMEAIEMEHLVEHWSHVEYGKGPGLLAVRFRKYFDSLNSVPSRIVIDSRSLESKALMDVLISRAEEIIRGIQ